MRPVAGILSWERICRRCQGRDGGHCPSGAHSYPLSYPPHLQPPPYPHCLHSPNFRVFASSRFPFSLEDCGREPATMPGNTFGTIFRLTTWGESHGPGVGCVVDGCPPGIPLTVEQVQVELDRRRP